MMSLTICVYFPSVVLSVVLAQAPGDGDSFCTSTLPTYQWWYSPFSMCCIIRCPSSGSGRWRLILYFNSTYVPVVVFPLPPNPPNTKILLDSYRYRNLLPPHDCAVWQKVDLDNFNSPRSGTSVSYLIIIVYNQ